MKTKWHRHQTIESEEKKVLPKKNCIKKLKTTSCMHDDMVDVDITIVLNKSF